MSKEDNNFFEAHIEKLVLGVAGLVCMWLLISKVLISPNYVEYEDKKFSPDKIDSYIAERAEQLEYKLDSRPEPKAAYLSQANEFMALVDSALNNVDPGIYPVQPNPTSKELIVKSKYYLPLVGSVNNVSAEHIRAVVYLPTEEIGQDNPYSRNNSEPGDIDIVTVEADIDVADLYDRFYQSFAGDEVEEDWRDPCMAKPIFAAVQLQRQQLNDDGSWSDWQIVPRTKIDGFWQMFAIIEDVTELPAGGIKVRLLQFDNSDVACDLLQPETYCIASAEEQWFPPTLHKKFVKDQASIKTRERREKKEVEKKEREEKMGKAHEQRSRKREDTRRETKTTTTSRGDMDSVMEMLLKSPGGGGTSRTGQSNTQKKQPTEMARARAERREQKKRQLEKPAAQETTKDLQSELKEIAITKETDFAKMDKPVIFWAHDDTVVPEGKYRYRIRCGVFNPIAGTNQFFDEQKDRKNQVILWSDFSEITEPAEIGSKVCFFPVNIQEAAKAVTVQVSKYVMGYWRNEKFTVKPGEVVGRIIDVDIEKSEDDDMETEQIVEPETIDYSTDILLVDTVAVNSWSGGRSMYPRYYFEMLYSTGDKGIERMAVKQTNWSRQMQMKFNEINKAAKDPHLPLRQWGDRTTRSGRGRLPGVPGDLGTMEGTFQGMTPEMIQQLFPDMIQP